MALELFVASLALVAYCIGSYVDEQRSQRERRRLRRLKDTESERSRLPLAARP